MAHKSPTATEAMERTAALYAIENEIRDRPPEERREVRNARTRPLLESLKQWLEETLVSYPANRTRRWVGLPTANALRQSTA